MQTPFTVEQVLFKDSKEVFNFPDLEAAARSYQSGKPYSYLVVENFFQPEIAEMLSQELYGNEKKFAKVYDNGVERNKTISTGDQVPRLMSTIAAKYSSPVMLRFLEKVTGLKKLIGDPYYNTEYGYYHIVGPGGVLGSHVDHSHHSYLQIPHVLNIVVYLTKDWDDADGGALCLFDETGKKVVERIPCKFNRAVIFECSPRAFHGVEPIREGAPKRRHSIYFAYYGVDQKALPLTDSFPALHRGEDNTTARYGTYFIVGFWDLFKWKNRNHLRIRIGNLVKLLLPPAIFVLINKVRKA